MTVSKNKVVTLLYNLKNEEGEVIDSNEDFEPLQYLQGYNQVMEAFEKSVEGMQVEEEKTLLLEPERGFGNYDPKLLFTLKRSDVGPQADQMKPGDTVESAEGNEFIVTQVNDTTITVDGNHPHAGKTLTFWAKVVALRNATDEELQKGELKGQNKGECGPACSC